MATIHQLLSGSWRAQIRRKGLPQKSQTFKTEREAKLWADEVEASFSTKRIAYSKDSGLTFNEAYKKYLGSPTFQNKAAKTQEREKSASIALVRSLGEYAMQIIDYTIIQEYIDNRQSETSQKGKKISGDTIRIEKALLSSVFKFCNRRGFCNGNPAAQSFDMPSLNKREIRISVQEELRLCSCAHVYYNKNHSKVNPSLLYWIRFVFATGMRPGEAAKIELAWINEEGTKISVPRSGHKTKRPRIVMVRKGSLTGAIKRAEELRSKYLFCSKNGKSPYRYSQPWRAICKMARLPENVVPHGVRHEFISRLFEETELSDGQIATLVGDVHPLSLEPYRHLRAETLRDKLESHVYQQVVKRINQAKKNFE